MIEEFPLMIGIFSFVIRASGVVMETNSAMIGAISIVIGANLIVIATIRVKME